MKLSLNTPLAERYAYNPLDVPHDTIHDALLDLQEFQALADTAKDLMEERELVKDELNDARRELDLEEERLGNAGLPALMTRALTDLLKSKTAKTITAAKEALAAWEDSQ